MNSFLKPVRILSLVTALSLLLGTTAMAADSTINETDIPLEVSDTISGTALGLGTVTGSSVNVRCNPNTNAEVNATLVAGEQVIVLAKEGDWYRISLNGITGFVSSAYMTLDTSGETELGFAAIDDAETTIDVRLDASEDGEVVTTITSDDVMEITGIVDGWYQVFVNGIGGYIESDQVNPTEHISAERIYGFAVISSNAVNVRAAADSSSDRIDTLYKGSLCELLAEEGDWYQISYNGTTGYVMSCYLSTTNDEADGSTEIETANEVAAREKAEAEAAAAAAAAAAAQAAAAQPAATTTVSTGSGSTTSYTYTEPESTTSYNYSGSSSIVSVAYNYLGVPYVWGGTSPSGFDCSGFTQYVFRQCGYSLDRVAQSQYYNGSYVSYSNLQPGDLVFFSNTYSASGITHVGIYVGDGNFIHASNSGIAVTSLSENWYASRYVGACRVA